MRPLLLIAALAGAAFALPDPQPTVALDMPVGDPQTTQTVHVHPKPCGGLKAKYCSWVLGGPGTTFTTTITNITTTTLTKLAVSIEHTTNPVSTVKE